LRRRLTRKTSMASVGSAGAESRSVTPPTRRSRDGSAEGDPSLVGLNPQDDAELPEASRRRLDGGPAASVVSALPVMQRPGVAREMRAPDMPQGEPGRYTNAGVTCVRLSQLPEVELRAPDMPQGEPGRYTNAGGTCVRLSQNPENETVAAAFA